MKGHCTDHVIGKFNSSDDERLNRLFIVDLL